MRRLLLLVILSCAGAMAADDGDFAARIFTKDGKTLPYRLLHPPAGTTGAVWPLVVFLHGAGERGDDNAAQLKVCRPAFATPELRARFPCFVLAPQCPVGKRWVEVNWGAKAPHQQPVAPSESMALLLELIPALRQELPIDASRIYLTGISMGGFGTWDLLARKPDWFAAAVPICGGADDSTAPALAGIPIWTFHGDRDATVTVERTRSMVAALLKAGGTPRYTEYADTPHNSWSRAYAEPELHRWLFAQRRRP